MHIKIERASSYTFIVFILIAAALSVGNIKLPTSYSEQELLSGRVAVTVEDRYNDEFPAKSWLTGFWAAVNYQLFGDGREGVVVGTDHWLFTAEEYAWSRESEQYFTDNLQLIQTFQQRLKLQGIELQVIPIPEKVSIYKDKTSISSAHVEQDIYTKVAAGLGALEVLYVDTRPTLLSAASESEVFMRTDTHWSPRGAQVVAATVAEAVDAKGPEILYLTEQVASEAYRGDLLNFIPVAPYFTDYGPPEETLVSFATREKHPATDLFADEEEPAIVLLGTSYSADEKWNFAGALRQALKRDLLNYAQSAGGPFTPMLDFMVEDALQSGAVQQLLWEIPVRYLVMEMPSEASEWMKLNQGETST